MSHYSWHRYNTSNIRLSKKLVKFNEKHKLYSVSELGSYFINHICNIFDEYKENKYQSQREFKDGIRSLDRNINLNKI